MQMRDREGKMAGFVPGSEMAGSLNGADLRCFVKQIPDSDGGGSGKSPITRFSPSSSLPLPFQCNISSMGVMQRMHHFLWFIIRPGIRYEKFLEVLFMSLPHSQVRGSKWKGKKGQAP